MFIGIVAVIVGVVLIIVALVFLFMRRSEQQKVHEATATETVTVRELTELAKDAKQNFKQQGKAGDSGRIVEVKGTIECDAPLTSEIGEVKCVYYHSVVAREYEGTDGDSDSDGSIMSKTETESIINRERRCPFWVRDATGRILVDPDGADFDAEKSTHELWKGKLDKLGEREIHFLISLGLSRGRDSSDTIGYRKEEHTLAVGHDVYVLGEATDSPGLLTIRKPSERGRKFIISHKSEEEFVRSATSKARWLLVGAIAFALGGFAAIGVALTIVGSAAPA